MIHRAARIFHVCVKHLQVLPSSRINRGGALSVLQPQVNNITVCKETQIFGSNHTKYCFSTSGERIFNRQKQLVLNSGDIQYLLSIGFDFKVMWKSAVKISEVSKTDVESIINLLKEKNLNENDIMEILIKYPRIAMATTSELSGKFQILYDLGLSDEDIGKMLKRAPSAFLSLKTKSPFIDFIEFLKHMGLTSKHMTRIIQRYPSNITRVKQIQNNVAYLKQVFINHNCEDEFPQRIKHMLVQDPYLFRQPVPVVEEKVEFLEGLGFSGPDLIRVIYNCPNALRISSDHMLLTIRFMKDRLSLTGEEMKDFIRFYPQILYCSIEKLEDKIDFFYSQGITAKIMMRTPAVFVRNLSLMKQRCRELKTVDFEFKSLNVLVVPPAEYEDRFERLRAAYKEKKMS
ncbi:transcription termination factor 1, mitochondrial-like [Glandiceps talaboti]